MAYGIKKDSKYTISTLIPLTLGACGLGWAVSSLGFGIGVDVAAGAGNCAAILRPGLDIVVSSWKATSFSGGS